MLLLNSSCPLSHILKGDFFFAYFLFGLFVRVVWGFFAGAGGGGCWLNKSLSVKKIKQGSLVRFFVSLIKFS